MTVVETNLKNGNKSGAKAENGAKVETTVAPHANGTASVAPHTAIAAVGAAHVASTITDKREAIRAALTLVDGANTAFAKAQHAAEAALSERDIALEALSKLLGEGDGVFKRDGVKWYVKSPRGRGTHWTLTAEKPAQSAEIVEV